jgi:hypothetical protein
MDSNYSINSVDVIINGGNASVPPVPSFGSQMPYPQQPGQFVWVPQGSYVKPPGGNGAQGTHGTAGPRAIKFNDRNRDIQRDRFQVSRGDKSDKRKFGDKTDVRSSRGDQTSRGDQASRGDQQYRKDRPYKGDTKTSASDGGDRKRDRPSSSRDHQAASMTVEACEENEDDEDDEESSSSEGESN